ncbi:hypothetical protein [Dactylosporangium matsuzakiense]|uniref:Uncharacterized protein n=1 Tax=Dactylosporangium matsuzakiense TaxID=53360 RepID=A0A9W6KQ88_9ACTN|nr:hypothetical protein [Dactylosporangium matsuzakiense]UWZ41891.1 hypothetical protein Dmats_30230 [Dactylosporangium matsuzakiense]GLL04445.1 hypothetical protein GCM10017581_061920 [Dactylosporangium matsuzakiense]
MRFTVARVALAALVATAASLAAAAPAEAASASCRVLDDGHDNYCVTRAISVAPTNIFHLATTGAPARNWALRITDVTNGVVVFNELQFQDANVWKGNVYASYKAEVICQSPCPNLVAYFANG